MTEERTIYTVPGQPAQPPDEMDLCRDLGLRLLVAEVTWRWWRDLAVSILLAWMKERETNERE